MILSTAVILFANKLVNDLLFVYLNDEAFKSFMSFFVCVNFCRRISHILNFDACLNCVQVGQFKGCWFKSVRSRI